MTDVDIRDRVEDDRGLIKKIQLIIPGYRGYRQREDIRIADSMLRNQVADQLKNSVILPLENVRTEVSKAMELGLMDDIAATLSKAQMMEQKIRHAEQGYSGISAGVRILQDELNRIYEYDLAILENIAVIADEASGAQSAAERESFEEVKKSLRTIKTHLVNLQQTYEKRIPIVLQINVV